MAWLRATVGGVEVDDVQHTLLKEILSAADHKGIREQSRDELRALAAADPSSGYVEILALEAYERNGDTHEPDSIRCRSIAGAMIQAAST